MKKLIEKLKGYLPITRKSYQKDLKNIYIIIQGLRQSEAQHSQMEMNLIQNVDALKVAAQKKKEQNGQKKTNDPAFG